MSKGKVLLALFALLAMPALSFGQGLLDLSGDKAQILQGESFTLTIDLSTEVGLQFGQYLLSVESVPGGLASDQHFTGQFGAEGDWFGVPGGFGANSLASNTQMSSPVSLDGLMPELIFHAGSETTLTSGSLATYMITADAAAPLGLYSLGLDPAQTLFTNADGVVQMGINPYRFEVTPEPASALLLLAGVPFLRRRRA